MRLCCIWLCVYVHFSFMILYFVRNDEIKLFNKKTNINEDIRACTQRPLSPYCHFQINLCDRKVIHFHFHRILSHTHCTFISILYVSYRILGKLGVFCATLTWKTDCVYDAENVSSLHTFIFQLIDRMRWWYVYVTIYCSLFMVHHEQHNFQMSVTSNNGPQAPRPLSTGFL